MRYLLPFALLVAPLAAQGALEQDFRALVAKPGPRWIAYEMPSRGGHYGCNGSSRVAHLEPPGRVLILFRAEEGEVARIRMVSPDCEIDAGGLPFDRIENVRPAESIALLAGLNAEAAVAAIAAHADTAADEALDKIAGPGKPEALREKAVFWMGAARGRHGYESLRRVLARDESERLREKAVFALHVSKEPAAVSTLIEIARQDKSPRIRGKALFWLADKAAQKTAEAVATAAVDDPDAEVKKQAVFALHRMPKDEGIPLLIELARTNRSPAVRMQAMFWLGQSHDPRAVEFFADVLK